MNDEKLMKISNNYRIMFFCFVGIILILSEEGEMEGI